MMHIFHGTGIFHLELRAYLDGRGIHTTMSKGTGMYEPVDTDLIWCDWADQTAVEQSLHTDKRLMVHVCSYEAYLPSIHEIDWDNVEVAFPTCQHVKERMPECHAVVLPDGIDLEKWPEYIRKERGWNIGVVAGAPQKNIPFAVELQYALPKARVVVKGVVDERLEDYLTYHRIERDASTDGMNAFYEEMDYILSCSYHESTHRVLLEGMAKDCIPLVQNRPGAVYPYTYNTVKDAVENAHRLRYAPGYFRQWVEENRTLKPQHKILDQYI